MLAIQAHDVVRGLAGGSVGVTKPQRELVC